MEEILNDFLTLNIFSSTNSSITHANQGLSQRFNLIKHFLKQRRLPNSSTDSSSIESILFFLSNLDLKNSLPLNTKDVASNILTKRYFRFGYFIPTFEDFNSKHYKQLGTSFLCHITNRLTLNAIHLSGIRSITSCCVVPMATGMTLALCMRSLGLERLNAKYVIWSRIDQKSCFKAIITAGFIPVIVPLLIIEGRLETNIEAIKEKIEHLSSSSIVCVYSTTSCFAPRCPDNIVEIGKLCKEYNIPHLVNNAYGLQSTKCSQLISETIEKSRMDLFVSSTDKNFMVPIGGSIIGGSIEGLVEKAANLYLGKGCLSPILDLFITLLNMGGEKYLSLIKQRSILFQEFKDSIADATKSYGWENIQSPSNKISLAISLGDITDENSYRIGQRIFQASVSGCRLVKLGKDSCIEGYIFKNWGAHHDNYPVNYLCCAVAIGALPDEIKEFISRLKSILKDLKLQKT